MKHPEIIKRTPWDSAIFGMDTYEIHSVSEQVLADIVRVPGHYTVKIDPLSSKKLLHDYGFYYCDTLLEPYCRSDHFVFFESSEVAISHNASLEALIPICHGAFSHGRFHRDFNLERDLADLRYDEWLKGLHATGNVFGLMYRSELVGFIGYADNKLLLHAISEDYRGKGLAKYLWSVACMALFEVGHKELLSSVSASNLPVLNLYFSLGFRFRNAIDVYHRLVL